MWLLLGCAGHLSSALQPDPIATISAPAPQPTDLPQAIALLVGSDPLLRRPASGIPWQQVPGAEPIIAWQAVYSSTAPLPADWWALERQWPGTIAVPLSRGARLADLESLVPSGLRPEVRSQVLALMAPLAGIGKTAPSNTRPPLAWLVPAATPSAQVDATQAAAALHVAERSVLLGWLDAPSMPVQAAAQALQADTYDRLLDSPAGSLLSARAHQARDAAAGAAGAQHLDRATTWALTTVAADRDEEQRRLKHTLSSAADELREEGLDVPDRPGGAVDAALALARVELSRDAGSDDSAGLAIVALTGERLMGRCPDGHCQGLDRLTTLRRAATWSDRALAMANTWSVIAAKQVLDRIEVTADRPTYAGGTADLVDLLLGEGTGPVAASLLRQRVPGPSTWLALTRATGAADNTTADAGINALRALVARLCERALTTETDPQRREMILQIQRRCSA